MHFLEGDYHYIKKNFKNCDSGPLCRESGHEYALVTIVNAALVTIDNIGTHIIHKTCFNCSSAQKALRESEIVDESPGLLCRESGHE